MLQYGALPTNYPEPDPDPASNPTCKMRLGGGGLVVHLLDTLKNFTHLIHIHCHPHATG